MFSIDDYDYHLPEHLIAQHPASQRESSRLLNLERHTGRIIHRSFKDLYQLLAPGDVVVVNDTEVIPGRLLGQKDTGGKVEVLILDYAGACQSTDCGRGFVCECLVKASKPLRIGASIFFDRRSRAEILAAGSGVYWVKFASREALDGLLRRVGRVPLPPYIKRGGCSEACCDDRDRYQTVYAAAKGAIAAPTAGLHFSKPLLERLVNKGIRVVPLTLHVGYGTFKPVRARDIRAHKMHSERYAISTEAARAINTAKAMGQRIVAVGTTCVRTIEYAADERGEVFPGNGCCDLFIYPGYRFKTVDAIVTNFHLPKSTLLMLVAAFAGHRPVFDAYREAVARGYRFYSYGDAMFIA